MLSRFRRLSFTEQALAIAAATSAALLAGAHIFEALGYAPCALCLDQREAHWAALGVSLAGLIALILFKARLAAGAAVGAAALVYAVSAGLSFFHAGVEYKFWPGPASCSATAGGLDTTDALTAALSEKPVGPACEDAQWRLFGVSMAGYNLIISAGLFALTLSAALQAARAAQMARRPTHAGLETRREPG